MFKIAICDDVMAVCHEIEKTLIDYAKANKIPIDVEVFYNGESLYDFILKEHGFDLIYLDIEMESLSGLDLGREIRDVLDDADTEIVFVSGTTQYDRQLFDVQPLHFIAKPVDARQVIKDLLLAIKKHDNPESFFIFHIGKDTIKLRYGDILYFASFDRKVSVITAGKNYDYYSTLQKAVESLPPYFCRIHKSYVVNMHHITEFHGSAVLMADSTELPIGQTYRQAFRDRYQKELFGEGSS